jgi:hypothetical protein
MHDRCLKVVLKLLLLFALVDATSVHAESFWERHEPKNRGVIVFVHGLTGDAHSTWTSSNGKYWPEMLTHDPAFDGQNIYVYEYITPLMKRALAPSELVGEMYDTLKNDGVLNQDEFTFISHSMGGIITCKFILRNQGELAGKIRMLLFLATPMNGSEFSKVVRLSFNPQVEILIPNDDPNSFLNTLQDDWNNSGFGIKSFCAYEKVPMGLGQVVVEKTGAVLLCGQPWRAINADHKTIAKPADGNGPSYVFFKNAFQKTAKPKQPSIKKSPDPPSKTDLYSMNFQEVPPSHFNLPEQFQIRFGAMNVIAPRDLITQKTDNDTNTVTPVGGLPLKIYIDPQGRLKMDATLYTKRGTVGAIIKGNIFARAENEWDANFDADAFEIVDGNRDVVFQMERRNENFIVIMGRMISDQGALFCWGVQGSTIQPKGGDFDNPPCYLPPPLFKYPNREHLHERVAISK